MIKKNAALLKEIYCAVRYLRRQDYLFAMRQTTEVVDCLMENIPEYLQQKEYFNQKQILVEEQAVMELLQYLLAAQQKRDYIWLADILELQLIPFISSLQKVLMESEKEPDTGMENYRLEYSFCGLYTLAVKQGQAWQYLHTSGNVIEEGWKLAESWFDSDKYHYVIYGLGLGYHVQALLEMDEAVEVTVLEPDIQIIRLARMYGAADLWTQHDRVQIVNDTDFSQLVQISENMDEESVFVIHYPSLQIITNAYYQEQLEEYFIQYSSAKTQFNRLAINFLRNQKGFTKEVSELEGKFKNQTVYIIAAGPSLDKNIQQLKKVQGKGIILATGTVLKKLLREQIRPDYVIIIDGGRATYKQIQEVENCQVPLLYMSTVYYKIPMEYQGEKYVIFQKDFMKSEETAKEKGYPLYESGGSVSTTALDIAIRFQCKKIVFIGLDLAYTDDMDHASDTASVRKVEQGNLCIVEDIYGNKVKTAKNLDIYRKWIEKRITREEEIAVIDATEGGARIEGTQIRKLSEILPED